MSRARAVLLLGAGVVAVVLVITLIEAISTPWALSLTGAPTLTGEWVGTLETKTGRTLEMWLSIEHPLPTGKCMNCPRIEGEVRTCEARRGERRYRMWGDVENWRGSSFLLKTLEEPERPHELTLGYLNGRWSGDALDLTTTFRVPGESVTLHSERDEAGRERTWVVGGDPDTHEPAHWRMQRGRERDFRQRCR